MKVITQNQIIMNKERITIKDTLPLVGFPGGKKAYIKFLIRARIIINENVAEERFVEDEYFYYENNTYENPDGKLVIKRQLLVRQRGVELLKSIVKRRMSWIIDNIIKNGFYK